MKGRSKNGEARGRLEGLGREVVRAAAANEDVAEAAAASPFLYARVRRRIAAERERRAAGGEGWLALLGVAWRAVPSLALVSAFAFALFVSTAPDNAAAPGYEDEALAGAQEAVYDNVVFADRAALDGDEVLATILDEGAGAQR
jgi:hypothetical protein